MHPQNLRIYRSILLALAFGLFVGTAGEVCAKNYYVRVTGDDKNHGKSRNHPFRTIAQAAKVAGTGDRIYVGAGTYRESILVQASGRANKLTQFIADIDGQRTGDRGPVLVQPDTQWAVHLDKVSYVTFTDFTFAANPLLDASYGVHANLSSNVEFVNCTFRDCVVGLQGDTSQLRVSGCRIVDLSRDGIVTNNSDLIVADSSFQGCGRYATANYGPVRHGTVLLQRCKIQDNYAGPLADHCDLTIDDCQIVNQQYWALVSESGDVQFQNQPPAIHDNGYGVYLGGHHPLKTERSLVGWDVSRNGSYGIYAINCRLMLKKCRIEEMAGWGMAAVNATVICDDSPIRNNGMGLHVVSDRRATTPSELHTVVVEKNKNRGIYHQSHVDFPSELVMRDCRVNENGGWGLLSYYGRVEIQKAQFRKNTQGLYLYLDGNLSLAPHELVDVDVEDVTSSHGIVAPNHDLTLRNCDIKDIAEYGVINSGANTRVENCKFEQCGQTSGYAIYNDSKTQFDAGKPTVMVLRNSTFRKNYGGPYANYCDLVLDDCTITDNRHWGLACAYGQLTPLNQKRAIKGNGQGLYIAGNRGNNQRVLTGWDFSDNDRYGIYGDDCNLVLQGCKIEKMKSWGAAVRNGTLTTVDSPIRKNGHGLLIESDSQAGNPLLVGAEVEDNDGYGIYHASNPQSPATLTLRQCRVEKNKAWPLVSYYGAIQADRCRFADSESGIYLHSDFRLGNVPKHRFSDVEITKIKSGHGIDSPYGEVTLENSTLTDIARYGVRNYYGDTVVTNCSFDEVGDDEGYAIYNHSQEDRGGLKKLHVKDTTITRSYAGPYANNSDLIIDNCRIEDNRFWGAVIVKGELEFRNQTPGLRKNGYGLYVEGNGRGSKRDFRGYDISHNSELGLCVVDCEVSLENARVVKNGWALAMVYNCQVDGEACDFSGNSNGVFCYGTAARGDAQLLRNLTTKSLTGYGIYGYQVDLQVKDSTIETRGSVGVMNMYNRLRMTDTTISGQGQASYGLFTFRNREVDLDRVNIGKTRSWGTTIYGGNLQIKNSIVADNASGMYLYSWPREGDVKRIWNVTLANNRQYGLVQVNGRTSVKNSILTSNDPSKSKYGLHVAQGECDHSHNLIEGYRQPVAGTSLGPGEIVGYARFRDAAAGDFQLTGSSMAINRGTDMTGYVDFDMVGYPRPAYDLWEIGAYEYTKKTDLVHIVEWQEKR